MVALMAAHGLTVGRPERVAELCQMVENLSLTPTPTPALTPTPTPP